MLKVIPAIAAAAVVIVAAGQAQAQFVQQSQTLVGSTLSTRINGVQQTGTLGMDGIGQISDATDNRSASASANYAFETFNLRIQGETQAGLPQGDYAAVSQLTLRLDGVNGDDTIWDLYLDLAFNEFTTNIGVFPDSRDQTPGNPRVVFRLDSLATANISRQGGAVFSDSQIAAFGPCDVSGGFAYQCGPQDGGKVSYFITSLAPGASYSGLFDVRLALASQLAGVYGANDAFATLSGGRLALSAIDTGIKPPPPPAAIPEPATWALMITGFGLAGGALRRRRVAA